MSFESFPSNEPEKQEESFKTSGIGGKIRRFVTGAALMGGALGSAEKVEAQSLHIPGTDKSVTLANPFRKHEITKHAEKVLTEEDKEKIAAVLEKYTVDKQSDSTYLVTDKKSHYSFPLVATGDENMSLNDILISLYNSDLSTQRALDNEKKLEKDGSLEGKPQNPSAPVIAAE